MGAMREPRAGSSSPFASWLKPTLEIHLDAQLFYSRVMADLQNPWEILPDSLRSIAGNIAGAFGVSKPDGDPRGWTQEEGRVVLEAMSARYWRESEKLRPSSTSSRDIEEAGRLSEQYAERMSGIAEKARHALEEVSNLSTAGLSSEVLDEIARAIFEVG